VDDLAEEPVGCGQSQAGGPDGRARRQAAADLPEAAELVERREETVDAERYQRVDAGELVALAKHRRNLQRRDATISQALIHSLLYLLSLQ